MKQLLFLIILIPAYKLCFAQSKTDTVKCYIQIYYQTGTDLIGLGSHIDDNSLFLRGGLIGYTRGYAIREKVVNSETQKDEWKYLKFLAWNGKREIKNVWFTLGVPQIMFKEW